MWNDSAALEELQYSIAHGAVGATCNPVIVLDVLRQEMHIWKDRIGELIKDNSPATEDEIAWALVEEISATRASWTVKRRVRADFRLRKVCRSVRNLCKCLIRCKLHERKSYYS